MHPLRPTSPEELPGLLMENELLRYEVAHLRARLAVADARPKAAAGKPGKPGKGDKAATAEKAAADGRDAEARRDLVRLVRRLDRSTLGPVLRRREWFGELKSRYLGDSGT